MPTPTENSRPADSPQRRPARGAGTFLERWFARVQRWFAVRSQTPAPDGENGVLGFLGVRRAIGYLGLGLPVVLPLVSWVFGGRNGLAHGPVFRKSLSSYYYSGLGGSVFVGSIFAIGIFLLCYRYKKLDGRLGNIACASAILLALFPTVDDNAKATFAIGYLHVFFASVFLITLTVICVFLFTLSNQTAGRTPRKRTRNKVYYTCGAIMTTALVAAAITSLFNTWYYALFACETVAVWAFGVAWIVKGEVLLRDATSGSAPVRAD